MTTSASSPHARASLRRLSAPHALDFGARLLQQSAGGVLTFREFVTIAREMVREQPERTATYLAALVALDMGSNDDDPPLRSPEPSPN
ncbi:MAG: hypothetical protein ACE37K_12185 [Planctomycetota bacterium]